MEKRQQDAFDRLKERLIKAPILQYPDYEEPFILFIDASMTGLGAVLAQKKNGKEVVIAYASRSTNQHEANYSITDLECLAVVWAVQHFQHYLFNHFTIVTDHSALKWLKTCKIPKGRRGRWILELQQYHFTIEHRAEKANSNANALSRMYETEVTCYLAQIEELTPDGYTSDSESEESTVSVAERIDMNRPLRKRRRMNYEREIMYFDPPTPATLSSESESVLTSEDESSSNEEWNNEIVLVDPNGEPIGTLFGDRKIRVEMEEIDETNTVVTPAYTYSMEEII